MVWCPGTSSPLSSPLPAFLSASLLAFYTSPMLASLTSTATIRLHESLELLIFERSDA